MSVPIHRIPGARPVIAVDPPTVTSIDAEVAAALTDEDPRIRRLAGHIRDDATALARIRERRAEDRREWEAHAATHRRASDRHPS